MRGALVAAFCALVLAPVASAAPPPLQQQKLREEVRKLKLENDHAQSWQSSVLEWAPFATVLAAVLGIGVPAFRELREHRLQRARELRQRFDDQFADAIGNLGSEKEAVRVSGAVSLASFLRPEYREFHEQIYLVLCANLTIDHTDVVNRFLVRAFSQALRAHLAAGNGQPLDLARCRLGRVDLAGLDLTDADLAFATLQSANLTGCRLVRAKGYEAHIEKARLSRADLTEIRFHKAEGAGAQFHEAKLISAKLRGATLDGAQFQGALLNDAHFDGAKLRGAHFENTVLTEAFFLGAELDEDALRSILRSKDQSWKKAHFDQHHHEQLEQLRRH